MATVQYKARPAAVVFLSKNSQRHSPLKKLTANRNFNDSNFKTLNQIISRPKYVFFFFYRLNKSIVPPVYGDSPPRSICKTPDKLLIDAESVVYVKGHIL